MSKPVKRYNLAELAYPDIREFLKESDIIMIPVGSCECHGQHLPLGTDTYQLHAIVKRTAELTNIPYTDPLMYGYSPHHIREVGGGIGTMTLRASTLNAILYDLGRCAIHAGFNKIMYIFGHASNLKVIDAVLRQIRYDTGAMVGYAKPFAERYMGVVKDILEGGPEETPGWHAGELETAQVMAWDESLVRMDRAETCVAKTPDWLPKEFKKNDGLPVINLDGYEYISFMMEHQDFAPKAIMGNPFRASKEKGERCVEAYAQHLAKAFNLLKPIKVEVKHREFENRAL
ncbi:MAG: Creatinine amidohydrolase [Firmicutes bacterium ADurb.Bin182]|nr:MAG: Creatinine amidohydrolase [Firmicutes bacterium ADurb.Bin182]